MKTILLSKTFWVQIAALLGLLFPPVKAWFDANPVQYLAALAAVNVLVRFLTSGAVFILPASAGTDTSVTECDDTGTSGRLPSWLLLAGLGGLVGFSPPACTPLPPGTMPISGRVITDGAVLGYSSKGGMDLTIDTRSAK